MSVDLTPQIGQAAIDPASATVDGQSVTGKTIADLIAADQYLKAIDALSKPGSNGGPKSGWGAVRLAKAIPPRAT